ncbi:MAG: hypothetical protein KDK36_01670 [Leptospiraceae bacterium]|nr:hypothetical protein [Leptospiraceae bacterium]
MKLIKSTLTIVILLQFYYCNKDNTIQKRDPNISYSNEVLLYREKPFTGRLVSFYEDGKLYDEINYKNGLKHGIYKEYYHDGKLSVLRNFNKGKREGIHKGWHSKGQIRFFSNYKNDKFTGENFSWYGNRQVDTYFVIEKGELKGFKQWRSGKKIFMNYVLKDNERIGLYGGRLCRTVKSDKNGKTVSF